MPNRKRLIELIRYCTSCEECRDEDIADHILASEFINELQNEAYDLGVDSTLHDHFGLSWKDAAELRKEIKRLQDKLILIDKRSPCETCKISTNPTGCNKKSCSAWRAWWLAQWEQIRAYGEKHKA